jgi:septum formation protein
MAKPVQPEPLVLASASPRREELLRAAGYRFSVAPSELPEPEPMHPGETPEAYAVAMAYFKAARVSHLHPTATLLGADTICVVGQKILGKPADRADAGRMIRTMSGTRHRVVTGVALYDPLANRRIMKHDVTYVRCRRLSDAEIERYLDSGAWEGKAGAYGIQDFGDQFIDGIEGSFSNVVGLPMELLGRMMAAWCEVAAAEAAAR